MSKIYLISDTHFGHRNIIRYCHRPFDSTDEMNRVMMENWNNTVNDQDLVYFAGDLGFRRHPTRYWLERLRGQIVFIKGNHDDGSVSSQSQAVFEYGGKRFYVSHYPSAAPTDWTDWVIHGHKHNNDLNNFPFINGARKTINVSVELIDYKPACLDDFIEDLDGIKRQETIGSIAERW